MKYRLRPSAVLRTVLPRSIILQNIYFLLWPIFLLVPMILLCFLPDKEIGVHLQASEVDLQKNLVDLPLCPPPASQEMPRSLLSEHYHLPPVNPGGWSRPSHCRSKDRVAILVPYRDRPGHLEVLLSILHPMLSRQNLEYRVFVVEQAGQSPFNRAKLLNVGFMESRDFGQFDCFIFHDVDLIPEDVRNLYDCPRTGPRHMSVAVSTMGYKLLYKDLFGGVSALTEEQMQKVNGFSNVYWGWGSEDNDMYKRIKHHGYKVERRSGKIARYMMLAHEKAPPNPQRFDHFTKCRKRFSIDGLSNLSYKRLGLELKPLYTLILVDPLYQDQE